MIHFHGNAEDLSHTVQILNKISRSFNLSIISVEYPNYGIYEYKGSNLIEKINNDAE
jgi:hypothetical protein